MKQTMQQESIDDSECETNVVHANLSPTIDPNDVWLDAAFDWDEMDGA